LDAIWILDGVNLGKSPFVVLTLLTLRNSRRRLNLKQKYAALGVALLAVLAVGFLATYSAPMAIADSTRQRGHGQAWWTEGLTQQQVNAIRQKIWDIRTQASAKGWTEEQTRTAIQQVLAQYGISPRGLGFVDVNGDGVCDHFGNGHGRGQRRSQCWNQTACPWT
jgi:hypothetical protein